MSFAVIHMKKFKSADVKGMQIHNQREKESKTNMDIDKERSSLNYDLLNHAPIDYDERIQQEIDERYLGERAIRKDAVKLCSFVVTSDKAFFDGLDPQEEKRFFEESVKFLQDRYGEKNMVYAVVHKDEKTPHMHVGMVPITSEGKLAAKQFFGKKTELQQLQDKFHEHVTKKGFDLERGVSSDRKHIEANRFKALSVKEEVKSLENELKEKLDDKQSLETSVKDIEGRLSDLGKSLNHVKKVDEVEVKEKGGLVRSRTVELAQEDFEGIKTLAKVSEGLKIKSEQLEGYWIQEVQKNDQLKDENSILKKENDRLKDENKELVRENTFLTRTLEKVKDLYKDKIKDFSQSLGTVKAFVLDKMGDKLLQRHFTDDDEIKGGQKFLSNKNLEQEREKQTQQTRKNRDSGMER
ncbi:plasmid recombination protein [Peribacillus sp. TH16]|uniref:MobV family relaxase n=1 Tax=Peribacillus sp. TH16 TaxID=2798482 RepID=UPI001912EC05|nr:MobV family relaxase [Peribacillus sp. TH16]MBK5482821.1 plasmid recombination protein [Peribacillus sp. TH16]